MSTQRWEAKAFNVLLENSGMEMTERHSSVKMMGRDACAGRAVYDSCYN